MKVSKQILLVLAIIFGACAIANAGAKKSKRIYRLESCDCIGMKNNIPTFLSDLMGEPEIEVESRSLARAKKIVDNKCYRDFRDFAKVRKSEVSGSGCKVFVSRLGSGRWKAL